MELGFHPSRHGDRLVPNLSQRPLFLGRDCWWGSRTFLRSIHLGTDPTVAGGAVGGAEAMSGRWVIGWPSPIRVGRICVGGATTNRSRHGLPDIQHVYLGE